MFTGRLNRLGYFLAHIYLFVPIIAVIFAYALANYLFATVSGGAAGDSSPVRSIFNVVLFLFGAGWIIFFIPLIVGINVRRWHDINATGWLAVLTILYPINFIVYLVQQFVPGTSGSNLYGPPVANNAFMYVLFGKK